MFKTSIAACVLAAATLVPSPASAQISRLGDTFGVFGGGARGTDIAYDATNNVYLVVSAGQGGRTRGRFVNAAGEVVGSGPFAIQANTSVDGHFPRVAYSPDAGGFLVTWHETVPGQPYTSVHGRMVTYPSGASTSDVVLATTDSRWEAGPAVAYATGSKVFYVTWPAQNFDARAILVNNSGQAASNVLPVASTNDGERDPNVAYNPTTDEFMVVYSGWGAVGAFVKVQRVRASDGANLGSPTLLSVGAGTYITDIAYNSNTNKFMTTWYQLPSDAILGRLVNADATPASDVITVSTRFSANDGLGIAFNTTSGTFFAISHDHFSYENGGVELGPSGVPVSGGTQITAVGGTYGNFYPRISGRANAAEWTMSSAHDFATSIAQRLSTTSRLAGCTAALSANAASIAAAGGGDMFSVSFTGGTVCPWTLTNTSPGWVTPSQTTGTGPATLTFTVASSTSTLPRSAELTISGKTFTITQAGWTCNFSINPANVTGLSPGADAGTIFVTASVPSGVSGPCNWSATSNSNAIGLSNPTGRTASGRLDFTIAANFSTTPRTATATIAGQTFTLGQMGATLDAGLQSIQNKRGDFNADGMKDILFQDITNGYLAYWYLQGGTATRTPQMLDQRVLDTNWRVVGTGDFNGDLKPDIVWRNQRTGSLFLWYMDGPTRIGYSSFSIDGISDTRWQVMGVGDFNSDGKPDIVWQHDTGWLAVWLMDNTVLLGGLDMTPGRLVDTNWRITGVSDLNGDGKTDLVFRHAVTGEIAGWLMNGAVRIGYQGFTPGGVADLPWRIAAITDIDGDQSPDFVWHNDSNGSVVVWYMNGTVRVGSATFSVATQPNWKIVGPK